MKRNRFEQNKSNIKRLDSGASAHKRKKRRRRSSPARIALVVTVLLVAATATVLSFTVFFKIKSIDVYGDSKYSSKEIIKAAEVKLESNLIRLDREEVSSRIEKKLPYIESVSIKKKLPTTLELKITAAKIAGYIEKDGAFYIVSSEGKLLEKKNKLPENIAKISGIELKNQSISSYISDKNSSIQYVKIIYDQMPEAVGKNITELFVGDRINLSFVYEDRITVRLGSETELAEKLKFVVMILTDPEKISHDDMGVIYAENAKKISFLRKGSYSEYLNELKEQQENIADENSSSTFVEEMTDEIKNPSENDVDNQSSTNNGTSN